MVGASPEVLVRLRDGVVTIRPLAGTRPRGATPEEDAALEARLGGPLRDAFPFDGAHCARLTEAVMARLDLSEEADPAG